MYRYLDDEYVIDAEVDDILETQWDKVAHLFNYAEEELYVYKPDLMLLNEVDPLNIPRVTTHYMTLGYCKENPIKLTFDGELTIEKGNDAYEENILQSQTDTQSNAIYKDTRTRQFDKETQKHKPKEHSVASSAVTTHATNRNEYKASTTECSQPKPFGSTHVATSQRVDSNVKTNRSRTTNDTAHASGYPDFSRTKGRTNPYERRKATMARAAQDRYNRLKNRTK